jgi:hypothetical protein
VKVPRSLKKFWREVWVKVSRSLKKFDESLGESFTKVWVKVSRKFGWNSGMTKDCKTLNPKP